MALIVSACGCQATDVAAPQAEVSSEIVRRSGAETGIRIEPGETGVPPGVDLADGLTVDEAVQVALWNNAALQETLTELGVSSARLLDAGLISDPQFVLFFPLGPKQLEFTTTQALDALWLQPIRVRAAELNVARVSQSMVQNGLDVIRDVRVAHAELLRATRQAEVSREAEALRAEIAALAQKRLDAGDISKLEATTSRIDALQATAAAERAAHDVTIARERLRAVIGLTMYDDPLDPVADVSLPVSERVAEDLVNTALAMRPDLRAAEIAIEAAGERAGLARHQFMNLDAVYDANGSGRRGFESGPGARLTLPIFNRNQGGIAIADAQWQQAARQYVTVRDRVVLEVMTAHTQLRQAHENLTFLREKILPAVRNAEQLARRNYDNGGAPYFLVLRTMGQSLDLQLRELQLEADVRRAAAELDRSAGRRVCIADSAEAIEIDIPPAPPADAATTVRTRAEMSVTQTGGWRPTHAQVNSDGSSSQVTTAAHTDDADARRSTTRRQRKRKQKRDRKNAGRTRSKNTDQDAEHVQVTIDLRLDPRLVPSGMRAAERGSTPKEVTGED